ncbi:glutamate decarboxylase 1-like [Physella acuta]|uniref:glutamate decarboxylase 1-like n=1 Tax=Physella acuta TaxID=109671 RepID=UPI0027DD2287|nr:glutamate decarboxylase 1-like [Physella acuta]
MYLNCGVFQKTKRGKEPETSEDATPQAGHSTGQQTTNKECLSNQLLHEEEDGDRKESISDWSDFENVFSKDFQGPHGADKIRRFLKSLCEILTSFVLSESDRSTKVVDFHHPHQLKDIMSHCLDVHPEPRDLEQVLSDCKETLKYCVKTGHAHFFNQLSTGIDIVGVAGAWSAAAANTNLFTYEAAPVFTLMEEVILTRMRSLVGWEDGEAIFAPGGAISNLYGVLLARHHALPEVKLNGISQGVKAVVFTSEHSHFSIKRAAAMLGLGTNNVIYIRCLDNGKMDVSDLKSKLVNAVMSGCVVVMVNATCGTTVLGAFDPVDEIADVCEEYHVWLHVDAAWGGGALLSHDHRYLMEGVKRADSITWNPHKMMGVPLQCSAFITKHRGMLKSCNGMGASYLFQKDKHYDVSYDTGDMSIQCGRHNDIFKLWLMWRAKGDQGFEEQINRNFNLARYLRDKVKDREGFHLVLEQIEAPNVCFWYLPPAWRTRQLQQIKSDHLHKVAPAIKAKMMEAGSLMVQYQPLGHLPNLFRVAISNPILTPRDIDFLLDEIDHLGMELPVPDDWFD